MPCRGRSISRAYLFYGDTGRISPLQAAYASLPFFLLFFTWREPEKFLEGFHVVFTLRNGQHEGGPGGASGVGAGAAAGAQGEREAAAR